MNPILLVLLVLVLIGSGGGYYRTGEPIVGYGGLALALVILILLYVLRAPGIH